MDRVILLRNFRGLQKGTELVYNTQINSFGYEQVDETIGDHIHSVKSQSVAFSREFVTNLLGQLFEDPAPQPIQEPGDCELCIDELAVEKTEHERLIDKYEGMLADLQAEFETLKQ